MKEIVFTSAEKLSALGPTASPPESSPLCCRGS